MDEAGHAGAARGVDDMRGRGRVARLEIGAGRDIDDACDMKQRLAVRRPLRQAVGPVERARDPGHAIDGLLRPAAKGADVPARDRTSVGEGKSWSVLLEYGGIWFI